MTNFEPEKWSILTKVRKHKFSDHATQLESDMTNLEAKNGQYSRILDTNQLTRNDHATEMQERSQEMR